MTVTKQFVVTLEFNQTPAVIEQVEEELFGMFNESFDFHGLINIDGVSAITKVVSVQLLTSGD